MGKPSTSIKVFDDTRDILYKLKKRDQTYDDVIRELMARAKVKFPV